jgi:hypothetical protein
VTWYFRALRERTGLTQRAIVAAARRKSRSIPLSLSGNLESRGLSQATSAFLYYTLLIGVDEQTLSWIQQRALESAHSAAREIARAVKDHRERLDVSQRGQSERSAYARSPVTKSYIAHQETAGPNTPVLVDLQYAAFIGADAICFVNSQR